jgi:BirA family biotin operon repressor/biotin-[acetyl-CoA-carboxylase] ligase
MAAVSVADTLNEQVRLRARIKWPNDVLVEGRKVAGVLGEVRGSAPEIREMVVGIGINVNQAADDFPPELAGRATSVRMETGAATERASILAGVLEGFERRYARFLRDGPAVLLREWESLSTLTPGARLSVQGPAGLVEGEFTGIDLEGALVVRAPAGSIQRIPFGELLDSLLG